LLVVFCIYHFDTPETNLSLSLSRKRKEKKNTREEPRNVGTTTHLPLVAGKAKVTTTPPEELQANTPKGGKKEEEEEMQ
ncbi:hypothetical protein G0P98_27805, partial [Yangia sp. PrR004]|nr:hypothetical protein [Salipiger sp. PrR004]